MKGLKITVIRLIDGSEVNATITDKIDNEGRQYSVAEVEGKVDILSIIDRDCDGPIWGKR